MSVAKQVSKHLEHMPKGHPFTVREFAGLGNERNIAKVLERLTNEGLVRRVRRGVYVFPQINPYVGEVPPSTLEVIKAVTPGETLQIDGAEAVRMFGLSTQSPVREAFLTNGRSRQIKIGNKIVALKQVCPKKLILAGTKAGAALTALWYLGKNEVSIDTIEKIHQKLSQSEYEMLLTAKECMPAWMLKILTQYEQLNKRAVNEGTNQRGFS